jgi:hypothetical protein
MRSIFSQARRAGFDLGLSTGKLTKAMVEVLLQLPLEADLSKDTVVRHLGVLGAMSKTRDINAAWKSAKRTVARECPERFCLDGKILRRTDEMMARPAFTKLSSAGHRRLAALAIKEDVTADEMLTRLIAFWREARARRPSGKEAPARTTRESLPTATRGSRQKAKAAGGLASGKGASTSGATKKVATGIAATRKKAGRKTASAARKSR